MKGKNHMLKAIFLDFYGTVVHEDGEVIRKISKRIMETGKTEKLGDIGAYWWNSFQKLFLNSYGDTFETQRKLEKKSLLDTIEYFGSTEDVDELSEFMFSHWIKPPIFDDSKEFFKKCSLPIYIVSNIDSADIEKAVKYHKLTPTKIFTSEDAKSYKPRKELFELALKETGLSPNEVIHIGDSLSSDIKGANNLGINAIWINRNNREIPNGVMSVNNLLGVFQTNYFV